MKKILYFTSILTLLIAVGLVVLLSFWSSYPYKTLQINKEPLQVITKEVKNEETLIYVLDYCKYMEGKVSINRKFIDGVVYSMPIVEANNATGCKVMTVGIEIPKNLPKGTYFLEISYTYKVNPIRDITATTKTESFLVN